MSRASPASLSSEASGLLNSGELDHNNLTSDYPGSDCSSSTSTLGHPHYTTTRVGGGSQLPLSSRGGFNNDEEEEVDEEEEEGFSHQEVIEDIEDGTSSVLSSSISSNDECLAYRAPWATPPTATFEGSKQLTIYATNTTTTHQPRFQE